MSQKISKQQEGINVSNSNNAVPRDVDVTELTIMQFGTMLAQMLQLKAEHLKTSEKALHN